LVQVAKIGATGIGPGWSTSDKYAVLLEDVIVKTEIPLVIDATGLYHLADSLQLLDLRPPEAVTIITPHSGEFARLFRPTAHSFERLDLAIEMAVEYKLFIVLKGAFTLVATPLGHGYFNSSGNPGMAKAGSGDVLTGIITALLAQRYSAEAACVLGVYAHGLAGDAAAQKYSPHGMKAMDIVNSLPKAWKRLSKYANNTN
jgi:ADP-dependent NAD(P)H-hydrate dehydratase / NAD(P)H-hydrate epimerase